MEEEIIQLLRSDKEIIKIKESSEPIKNEISELRDILSKIRDQYRQRQFEIDLLRKKKSPSGIYPIELQIDLNKKVDEFLRWSFNANKKREHVKNRLLELQKSLNENKQKIHTRANDIRKNSLKSELKPTKTNHAYEGKQKGDSH